jgi:capsular polysaccharide biosynthesis protein
MANFIIGFFIGLALGCFIATMAIAVLAFAREHFDETQE